MGWRTEEIAGSEEKKLSGLDAVPLNGIGLSGVRLSPVMVTGRQKLEVLALKVVKASWSSWETGWC